MVVDGAFWLGLRWVLHFNRTGLCRGDLQVSEAVENSFVFAFLLLPAFFFFDLPLFLFFLLLLPGFLGFVVFNGFVDFFGMSQLMKYFLAQGSVFREFLDPLDLGRVDSCLFEFVEHWRKGSGPVPGEVEASVCSFYFAERVVQQVRLHFIGDVGKVLD